MKALSISLIMTGIIILSYPFLYEQYRDFKAVELISLFEDNQVSNKNIIQKSFHDLTEVFLEFQETEENVDSVSTENTIMGKVEIPKINVSIPILAGATDQNLKYAAGHLIGTAIIGEIGTSAIAAHRSHSFGRLFNRLGEVEIGDLVYAHSNKGEYVYEVFEVQIVKPDDVSVLYKYNDKSVLTLITCEPMINPTHRLILHSKLIDDNH
ncbi:class D sortase [Bacillus sp. FJAT-45066]|uniref:class D sortase n=1 Tax=Bacillus sp. FJAT-45066 TaxID=2011010 RepID=UPI000BB7FF7A|nr:class D sortase [Bacillus sp. FJAT-45066]